jgi:hypothetical protein
MTINKIRSNFIDTGTTPTQVAVGDHTHSGYATNDHLHTGTYANVTHPHSEYALTSHTHTGLGSNAFSWPPTYGNCDIYIAQFTKQSISDGMPTNFNINVSSGTVISFRTIGFKYNITSGYTTIEYDDYTRPIYMLINNIPFMQLTENVDTTGFYGVLIQKGLGPLNGVGVRQSFYPVYPASQLLSHLDFGTGSGIDAEVVRIIYNGVTTKLINNTHGFNNLINAGSNCSPVSYTIT